MLVQFGAMALAASLLPSVAFADSVCSGAAPDSQDQNAGHYRATHVEVVVHHGRGGPASVGFNDIDSPAKLTCKAAAGCLLTVERHTASNTGGAFCSFVDGVPMRPHFDGQVESFEKIAAGSHSAQTKLWADNPGSVLPWVITYTLYDK